MPNPLYRIRGLEWERVGRTRLIAKSPAGPFIIWNWSDKGFSLQDADSVMDVDTLDAAKALAQARHEERMKLGLVPVEVSDG